MDLFVNNCLATDWMYNGANEMKIYDYKIYSESAMKSFSIISVYTFKLYHGIIIIIVPIKIGV